MKICELILKSMKPSVNIKNRYGKSPLIQSVENGDIHIFELLLYSENIDPNIQDNEGLTPLMHAISKANPESDDCILKNKDLSLPSVQMIFKLFNHANINLNLKDNFGHNIIFYLLQQKYKTDQKEINIKTPPNYSWTNLEYAPYPECLESNKMFLESNSFPCTKQWFNDLINVLISKNVEINQIDFEQNTLLKQLLLKK